MLYLVTYTMEDKQHKIKRALCEVFPHKEEAQIFYAFMADKAKKDTQYTYTIYLCTIIKSSVPTSQTK